MITSGETCWSSSSRSRKNVPVVTMKTVKIASTKYLDGLPSTGNEHGRAFRDLELEKKILGIAQNSGIGAQFGGKYFALDVRVLRLPRHPADR